MNWKVRKYSPISKETLELNSFFQVLLLAIFLSAILVQGAVLKREEDETNSRQKRTLGLLTVGANALSDGVGTAGVLAGTAIAAVSAIKPLLLLGIGKCK